MDKMNQDTHNLVCLAKTVQIYEGICMSSPRTVKTTKDILELWWHEVHSVLADEKFGKSGSRVKQVVEDFIREKQ